MNLLRVASFGAVALALAACTEKPQTASQRKADSPAYAGGVPAFTAAGWKAGDATGWDAQMRARAQNQNEYTRAGTP
jgi:hypothetical protein